MSMSADDVRMLLDSMKGAAVQLYSYSVSHSRLELRLVLASGSNVHLVCEGCRRICSPTAFGPADFELQQEPDGTLILRDVRQNFEVECRTIGSVKNVAPVF